MNVSCWDFGVLLEDPAREAERAEADGWSGMVFPDSQNMMPDVYISLALAARATSTMGLATGVTNPVTRHPNVTASAAMTLQQLSAGRFRLGIGRGDSSLAFIGRDPASVATLSRYIAVVRQLMHGDCVAFDQLRDPVEAANRHASSVHNLGESELGWIRDRPISPAPVEVVATGPKVIALAATSADAVVLAVGADESRIQWAIDIARASRREAGLDPDTVEIGAYVSIAIHPDAAVASQLVRPAVASTARFATMHGRPTGPVTNVEEAAFAGVAEGYDMHRHGAADSLRPDALSDEFLRKYAIIGSPDECIRRIESLVALGISRFFISRSEPLSPIDRASADAKASYRALVAEVIPTVTSMRTSNAR